MGKYIYQAVLHADVEGGYWVDVPNLPGCISEGDTFQQAVEQIADAMKTYVAALLRSGEPVPEASSVEVPNDCESVYVYFETDEHYIVEGEVVSAAEAARRLKVSAGRVTQMLDAGLLEGYREGRRTFVSVASIEHRLAESPKPGRPRKSAALAAL